MKNEIVNKINKAVEYLNSVLTVKPLNVTVEEMGQNRIVLSYETEKAKVWITEKIYKEFIFVGDEIKSMKMFNHLI